MGDEIQVLRAKHLMNLYFDYIRDKKIPTNYSRTRYYRYPILVTDSIDDICKHCRTYPLINFCKGPKNKNFDHKVADVLGVEIGKEYELETLLKIFESKPKEQAMKILNVMEEAPYPNIIPYPPWYYFSLIKTFYTQSN